MTLFKSFKVKFFVLLFFSFLIFLQGVFHIPPLDRDESRFASATKNMLETSDFIDIRLDNEPRYKKPIGIYWAQSLSNYIFGEPPFDKIWVYRIPSLLGCLFSILLIFTNIRKNFNEEVAFMSSFFLISSFLIISEIHQAKSDGLLFLCINICNLTLLNFVNKLEKKLNSEKNFNEILIFWCFLGFGTLIKGPIILIFVGLPIIFFSIITKTSYLLKCLHSTLGYILYVFIVLPWFILITMKAGEHFWYESVINDLLRKVSSGQESHGFLPGYYSLLLFIFFWPGCIFLIDLLKKSIADRKRILKKDMKVLFLFCWFLPGFFVYELIFTKLPHYVLPTYPALSILISLYIYKNYKDYKFLKISNIFLSLIFPISIIGAFIYAIYIYSSFDMLSIFITIFLILLLIYTIIQFKKRKIKSSLLSVLLFQTTIYLSLVFVLNPKLNSFWIAKNINNIIDDKSFENFSIYSSGFNEPSLIFLSGHKLKKISPESMAKESLIKKNNLFILSEEKADIFLNHISINSDILQTHSFEGFNYSKGQFIKFKVFKN